MKMIFVLAVLIALTACGSHISTAARGPSPAATPWHITGTVTSAQRIPIQRGAVVLVVLLDLSRKDNDPERTAAFDAIKRVKTLPVPFSLAIDPSKIDADHTYTVRAAILSRDGFSFLSTSTSTVRPGPGVAPIELTLISFSDWKHKFVPKETPSPYLPPR
jgi:uncharacterized lipoprotein YbaY